LDQAGNDAQLAKFCDRSVNIGKNPLLMAATTAMVHDRVDEKIKAQAAETRGSMGLTVSDAVRVFLTRIVADKELPFALKAPNETSRAAIAEGDQIDQRRRARFASADALLNGLQEACRK
jgi:DNA-damage-inducible protein J